MSVTDLTRSRTRPPRRASALPTRPQTLREGADLAVVRRASRPLAVLLLGYPVWWALGVQIPMWPVAALPLLAWLVTNRRRVDLPPGYGVLLLLLGWMLLSGLMLSSARYAAAYGLRLTLYLSVAVMAFFVWNALRHGLERQRVLTWLLVVWGAAVVLALPGLLVAPLEFPSPFGTALRTVGITDPYINAMTRPRLVELDQLYDTARPSALFPYTNDWGAAMGVLTPVAVHGLLTSVGRRRLVIGALLVASAAPILVSVNRGAWISIVVAVAYVLVLRLLAGRPKVLLGALAAAAGVAALVVTLPGLRDVLLSRFATSNVSTRETLYQASWELALRSPVFGYGSPQSSEGLADSNDVSIGTHGQFWTTLVSQGLVGAALLIGAILAIWWHSRPVALASPDLWLHATGVVLVVQTAFYDILPVPLAVALFALAVCAAGRRATARPAPARHHPTTIHGATGPVRTDQRPERKTVR